MNYRSTLFVTALLACLSAYAADVDLSKLPPPAPKTGVTFEADIKPLFETSCVRCHGAQRPKGGLRLDTLEGVLKGTKDGKVVQPGNSAKSQLVIAVSQLDPESAMPPKPRRRGPGGPPPGPGGPGGNPPAEHSGGMTPPAGDGATPPPGASPGGPQRGMQGPPPKPLTPEQVGLVRAWIDQGAK